MSKLLVKILLVIALAGVVLSVIPGAGTDQDRKASLFKVGEGEEEWQALPEVFSNLDFDADNAPASEEDYEAQLQLRSTRFWGRLYLDGWPQTIQFFRAHFGQPAPLGRKQFVFAEPRDACSELTNADILNEDFIVLVNRGTCTYGQKAKNVQKAGAAAVLIINNEPGLDHLPGPDAHDIEFSVASIPQQEGQLLESIYDEGPAVEGSGVPGRPIYGYMVPINCENSSARCLPATYEERKQVSGLVEGGLIKVAGKEHGVKDEDEPLEYLLAHFGTKITHEDTTMSTVVARPAEACGPIENDVKGKAVLVRRGGCPFVKKAEEVQAAGGRVIMLGNLHPHIVRMGVEPRWKGLNTVIPVVMISKRVYGILVAESMAADNFEIAFSEDIRVGGKTWETLEKLSNGEGWPRSDSYVEKKYNELKVEHADWPDRIGTLEDAYQKKIKKTAAAAAGSAAGSDKSEL